MSPLPDPAEEAVRVRPCAVVPTYNNPATLEEVVDSVLAHLDHVFVVDDGSGPEAQAVARRLGERNEVTVILHEHNLGKGHAVLAGFRLAQESGWTHAVQIDADGQHCSDDIPRFLEQAYAAPEALILGVPKFDETAPRSRVVGRRISCFWVDLEVGRGRIEDPLYGFRVYPLAASLAAGATSLRMGFDTDIAVRMVWAGTPTRNLPSRVRYFAPEDGGITHFRPVRSNLALSWLHTRLFLRALVWRFGCLFRR